MATTKAKTSKARKPSSGGAKAKGQSSVKTRAAAKKPAKKKAAAKKPARKKAAAKKPAKKQSGAPVLRLDAAIYPKAVLSQAAQAFAGLAQVQIRKQGREQVVTFIDAEPDVADQLPDEFANYALSCLVILR